jgi:putative tricarboxylic transport membrane protein
MTLGAIGDAALHLFTPFNMAVIFGGVTVGVIFGAIPGFTGSNTVAIMLPLTLTLAPEIAIVFLAAIYVGANYGAAIPAILINTPGSSGAAATVLDAYPLAKKGLASKALGISILSSVTGGIFSAIVVILLMPRIGEFTFQFGNREIFVVALFGIATVAVAVGDNIKKGFVSGAFGLFLATWPADPSTGQPRMDFGFNALLDSIPFIPIVIGVFAIAELFSLINKRQISENEEIRTTYDGVVDGFKYVLSKPYQLARSVFIGTSIGSIPGADTGVGGFISWSTAKSMSSDPDSFGEGNPDGVIASESANNAVVSGTFVPTLTLGIPGSATTAVMLAGLLLHGIRPGPGLLEDFSFEITVILVSVLLANIALFIVAFAISKYVIRIVTFPSVYLVPAIVVLTAMGSYVVNRQLFDVGWMVLFGFVGILMIVNEYSLIPLILGVVLGPILEGAYLRRMQISRGDHMYFFESDIALGLWTLIALVLLAKPISNLVSRIKSHNGSNS